VDVRAVTIKKGQAWGVASPLPEGAPVVSSDASLGAILAGGPPFPVVGLLGGDLCRTLGGRGDAERLRSSDAMTFPVDVVSVSLDGGSPLWSVAHVVARSRGWRRVFVAMNAQWMGEWNVAPRGHPGDGRVETLSWRLSWREARQVRARLPRGAHLPHPAISAASMRSASVSFPRALPVWVDGVHVGRARSLTVTVEPDAVRVVV
jgi:hypothetical protein